MKINSIKKESEYIRRLFFPMWDKKREWKIKLHSSAVSWCDRKRKIIFISCYAPPQNSLYSLLVHEMSHAVSNDYHKSSGRNRMMIASKKAKGIGNHQLAKMILWDLRKDELARRCLAPDVDDK